MVTSSVQYSAGQSERVLTEEALASVQRIAEMTAALGTSEQSLFSLSDLSSNVADYLSNIRNGILTLGLPKDSSEDLSSLVGKHISLQRTLNNLNLDTNLGQAEKAVVNLALGNVTSSLSSTLSLDKTLSYALGNSKLSAINSIAQACPIIGAAISKAQNVIMGMIAAVNRKIVAAIEIVTKTIQDAVGEALQAVQRKIEEGIIAVIGDINDPDHPLMKLGEHLRSVASMVNKVIIPIKNLIEKASSCMSSIQGSFGDTPNIPNLTPSISQNQRILNSLSSSNSVSEFLLNGIKETSSQQLDLAGINIKASTSYYTVGPYLDDLLQSKTSESTVALTTASSTLESLKSSLTSNTVSSINSIIDDLESLKSTVPSDIVSSINSIIDDLESLKSSITTDKLNSIIDDLESLKSSVPSIKDKLNSIIDELKSTVPATTQDKINSIIDDLDSLKDNVETDFSNMLDTTRTNIEAIEDYSLNQLEELKENINGSVDDIQEMISTTFTDAANVAQTLAFPEEESTELAAFIRESSVSVALMGPTSSPLIPRGRPISWKEK